MPAIKLQTKNVIELEVIQNKIFEIRRHRVMLDIHLAELYEVETRTLKQAVRRNYQRFPKDFMFELTEKEFQFLRSQSVISSFKSTRYSPLAFTEQGVAMLSSVLRSEQAIRVNIEIMRAFVNLRKLSLNYSELANKIDSLEDKYDKQFSEVFQALRYLIDPPKKERRKIGYTANNDK